MKYILLIHHPENAWPAAEHAAAIAESVALCHELHARGEYLGASPLHPGSAAVTLRQTDGKVVITDGPFAETYEQLGGFFLIDVADLDAAIGIARRIPGGRRGTVEIRPLAPLPQIPVFA
jgi:hypothetical protein